MRDRISNLYQFVLGVIESIYMQCRLYTVRKNGRAAIKYCQDIKNKASLYRGLKDKKIEYLDGDIAKIVYTRPLE